MANEIDQLDPIPETVVLRSGMTVQLESLKGRQFFKLLRIVTHGALPGLRDSGIFNLDFDNLDVEEFIGRFLSVVIMAIPDAEDETFEFLRSMCYPAGLIERRGLNKQDIERNTLLWEALDAEMENPELDDMVTIIEAIVKREAADIQALGKRLASMIKLALKTGQIPESPSPTSTSQSSVESPAPSTSSRRNTAGRTTSSSRSRSVESANVSLLSESGSIMHVGSNSIG